jgi:hypothetical protein
MLEWNGTSIRKQATNQVQQRKQMIEKQRIIFKRLEPSISRSGIPT